MKYLTNSGLSYFFNKIKAYLTSSTYLDSIGISNSDIDDIADNEGYSAGSLPQSDDIYITGDIIPNTDNSVDIGASSKNIKMVYTKGITINGTQFLPSNYVDLTNNQTIDGEKTFSKIITVKDNTNTASKDLLYLIDDTINTSNEDENGLPLTGHTNSLKIRGYDGNMLPCTVTGQVFTNGDTSAELRTYKYKDISSSDSKAIISLRYIYSNNSGIVFFSNVSHIIPNITNTTNLGSPSLQWNNTYTRNILIDNDINIASSLINKTSSSGNLALRGGTNYSNGASLALYGKDYVGDLAGNFTATAYGNSDYTSLRIYPSGTMSVYNNSTNTTKNIAMQEDFIPRGAGTVLNGTPFSRTVNNSELRFDGGTGFDQGASLSLSGKDRPDSGLAGAVFFRASDGSQAKTVTLYPNGTFMLDNKNVAMYEDVIPRSGGAVMTGSLYRSDNASSFAVGGGSSWDGGGSVELYGNGWLETYNRGKVCFQPAMDSSSQKKRMELSPNGTWTWDGTACVVSSDGRLKDEIESISDDVLDAWENLEPKQYKLKSDLENDKDNAQIHYGWIAQDVESVIKGDRKGDVKSGLWLHQSWDEQEEISHEEEYQEEVQTKDGNTETVTKTRKVIDTPYRAKGDSYGLRYTECLVVECKYLRRENSRLKEKLASFEERLEKLEKSENQETQEK